MSYVDESLKDELVKLIETTDKTWVKGIICMMHPDVNIKGVPYKGINTLILAMERAIAHYDSNEWCTFKGVADLGGTVKKGEKATKVILWMPNPEYTKMENLYRNNPTDELKQKMAETWRCVLRAYPVFNKAQTNLEYKKIEDEELPNFTVEACENLIKGFEDAPKVVYEHIPTAYYQALTDSVHCPSIGHFESSEKYYGTLFHELAHSTGHPSRLNRKLGGGFGSSTYAKEELIAEISACVLNAECGLKEELENHAVYLKSWLKSCIGERANNLINAFSQADKAVAWIKGEK